MSKPIKIIGRDAKNFLLDGMTWSFSRVGAYDTCPRMFYLQYIQEEERKSNAFAEWGNLAHSLFERYYKHELEFYELADAYTSEYDDAVPTAFPFEKMGESYYLGGKEYFAGFDGEYEDWSIAGVELKTKMKIDGRNFTGYIDLLLVDKAGNYKIVDFKSKGKFKSQEEKDAYAIQLYLYAMWVYEKYGSYPIAMEFNMFRAGTHEHIIFELSGVENAKHWFESNIQAMYDDDLFVDKISIECERKGTSVDKFKRTDFFCNNICSVGYLCDRSCKYEEEGVDPELASGEGTRRQGERETRGRKLYSHHGASRRK